MKSASLLFFVLLVAAHQTYALGEPLEQPLCSFREGAFSWLGYTLFGSIAVIGLVYTIEFKRLGQSDDAAGAVGAGILLLIIAATPAHWPLHRASAAVLLGSIYLHYAILLLSSRTWLIVHLSVPLLLAVGTAFQSYGLWQKGMIAYLVVVAVVHHHVAKARAAIPPPMSAGESVINCAAGHG